MIDLLAVHDIIDEVRQIVNKRQLDLLLGELTASQQRYLQHCFHQKTKLLFEPIQIWQLYKEKKQVGTVLHKRGLRRLAVGLAKYPTDFIWHLAHIFDIGRGKILLRLIEKRELSEEATAGAGQMIQMQVQQIYQILRKMRRRE